MIISPLIAMLLTATTPLECSEFAHESNPEVVIVVSSKNVTVTDHGEPTTYEVAITKPYGQPIEVALEGMDAGAVEHYFQIVKIDGRDTLIFDSQLFLPTCK